MLFMTINLFFFNFFIRIKENVYTFAAKLKKLNKKNIIVMTKAEIVAEIANKTGVEKASTQAVVESFMEIVKAAIINGDKVFLRGFGTYKTNVRAEKIGRNIKEEQKILIPEHNIPVFKPAKSFLNEVKQTKVVKE